MKVEITPEISYIPASDNPLSSDVVFICTENSTWIYDVGASDEAAQAINEVEGKKNIVISHFHPDHMKNLVRVTWDNLYVSSNTRKYAGEGTVVEGKLEDKGTDPEIELFELPSSHSKGSLCLRYGDYCFLGDATYCKISKDGNIYNVQLLHHMIAVLEKVDVRYFCVSHNSRFVLPKDAVLRLYRGIYGRRINGSPFIPVDVVPKPDLEKIDD